MIYFIASWLLLLIEYKLGGGITVAFLCSFITTILFTLRSKGITPKRQWIRYPEYIGLLVTIAWGLAWKRFSIISAALIIVNRLAFFKLVELEAKKYTNFSIIVDKDGKEIEL